MRVFWFGIVSMLVAVVAVGVATTTAAAATVPLSRGCNDVTLTFPSGTEASVVAAAVQPQSALLAVWRVDAVGTRDIGYAPAAAAVSDLQNVTAGERVSVCVNAPATLTQPDSPAVAVPTQAPTAAPSFRTILALNAAQLGDVLSYQFSLTRPNAGRVCATIVSESGARLSLTISSPSGPVFTESFTDTSCRDLNLPAGSYTVRGIQITGAYRIEIQERQ